MTTRNRLAGKTKQGAKTIVDFGWQKSIREPMFTHVYKQCG
jgi:dynactin complex subunit